MKHCAAIPMFPEAIEKPSRKMGRSSRSSTRRISFPREVLGTQDRTMQEFN